jgi:hypothetical protein
MNILDVHLFAPLKDFEVSLYAFARNNLWATHRIAQYHHYLGLAQ